MKEKRRELLKDLNPHLLCVLCAGYYIDPTTIVECLHSFCRSCIVKYLDTSRFCPICDVQLHKTKPLLSIRRDKILERLVYKIVPGLYAKEMARRASPIQELYISPDELISVVLQYHMEDASYHSPEDQENCNASNQDLKAAHRKFLQCPAAVTMEHLKKFLVLKYNLTDQHQVEIFHSSECLSDDLSIIDVAYCFEWKQTSPLELYFQILEKSTIAVPIVEEVETVEEVDIDEDSHSVASSSLPFMSPKSISDCDEASNTSLDSKPLIERLESEERAHLKRKRDREVSDEEPEQKKSLFDSLLQSTTNNNENENENEDKDFQESDEDYSKYEQDIEEIIEVDDDDDDIGRLRISSNVSEDETNNYETTSQMFVIDEAIEEEKYEKVIKEKHWKSEGRNKKKSKKAKHHHHHKRRLSQSPPPTATIVHSPDRDIMKLKVKLNTLPGYRHKDDKHHKYAKHCNGSVSSASSIMSSPSTSSYKEDDSVLSEHSCDSVIIPKKSREEIKSQTEKKPLVSERKSQMSHRSSQAVSESPKSETLSSKESLQPMRTVRPKPNSASEHQSNTESSHKMIVMPPSSITVSIITAEEKLKMEKDKTLMLTGNHDYENKRPSLEIVRVNGPPTTPPATIDVLKASPKTKEQHEEQPPLTPSPRSNNGQSKPKTKKPVPAVIPLKSAKPSITITPQSSRSPNNNNNTNNNNNNNNGVKHDEMKTSVTISLENGSQNDSALDLSGKSSRKDGLQLYSAVNNNNNHSNNNKCTPSYMNGGQYEPSGMRNLMTLSDTAVHIRSLMSSSPSPTLSTSSCKEQPQDTKKRFSNNNGHVSNCNTAGSNGSCSPKRHNGSVPLRIPVPPTSVSFGSQNKPVKLASRASDTKPKHGPPNQAVRHIPNPSVLLFRHQQHMAQFAVAAAANAMAANNNKRPSPVPVASRIPPHTMPAAIPLHTIRKMENMTKNIEKVAAGLSVKANALYKQNFIENGRARLELPS